MADSVSFPNFYDRVKDKPIVILFLNHVPDALWDYSLTCFLIWCFSGNIKNKKRAALIVLGVSLTEVIQVFFSTQFTFDWADLLLAVIISLLTLNYFKHEKKSVI
ncbi:hypothetical protein GCM10027043_28560 [Ferruginibacter profundus]